jgi:hypothetical protein
MDPPIALTVASSTIVSSTIASSTIASSTRHNERESIVDWIRHASAEAEAEGDLTALGNADGGSGSGGLRDARFRRQSSVITNPDALRNVSFKAPNGASYLCIDVVPTYI